MISNKQKYRQICKSEISIPIFSQDWWLDAVCGEESWDVVLIEKDEKIIATLPYYRREKLFFIGLNMPSLTQTLGPWLAPLTGKYATQLAQQKEIFTALIEQLPPYDFFHQNFHYSITNWLPFYWHGFTQTTRYTYVIEDLTDLNQVWNNFQSNTRRVIRKAEKEVVVHTDLEIDKFLELHTMTFQRQGKALPYNRELVLHIEAACLKHQSRQIFFAEDNQGRIHAVLYLIWDDYSAYYLMGGGDPKLRNSGAMTLLMWEAIQFASTVTKKFDFEGSMIEPIEIFFRDFGAKQIPYFQVTHTSRRMKPLMAGRDIFKALVKPA
ncbi:GNAT family N-acetyltransferase [Sphaerospermopsis aphanizomenoides BCCUSP55]|uniref:GNAT family N-acetyltransferase n=1 Tax=Sphaerospermopsis aphanizomenoides TaxID=459663 RepID=UPI0019043D08|nr:GNAT family N-acetyltransferase [Sphaerospermopsis aphanizomenoides]MBK1988487.1 GNAT family N-acetyltransferase [Sphaerospermopsis aphanizomenoides BCCUSP55]